MIVTREQAAAFEHVVVGRNGRLYARRFDHDEARRLHAAGVSVSALAERFGVSINAIHRVVTPGEADRQSEQQKRWRTVTCESCGGPAMRLTGSKKTHSPDGRLLCKSCRGRTRRKPIRVAGDGTVEYECGHCQEWKALDDFPPLVARRLAAGVRVRRTVCRACDTAARRRYRDAHKVPCEACGAPCLPPNEKGARGIDKARCFDCYQAGRASVRAELALVDAAIDAQRRAV